MEETKTLWQVHPCGPPQFSAAAWKLPPILPQSLWSASLSFSCFAALELFLKACTYRWEVEALPLRAWTNVERPRSFSLSWLIARGDSLYWAPIVHICTIIQLINALSLSFVSQSPSPCSIYDHWNQLPNKLYLNPGLWLWFWEKIKKFKLNFKLRHMVK